jgi:ABC-type multidrug transport system ATPase subunit
MLEIDGLTRSFRRARSGDHLAVGPIDLRVARGERLALTGPNGSGKSTLLRCIAGTIAASSGTVTIAGHAAGSRGARRLVGVSFSQERSFYLRLTGCQNLLTFARLRDDGGRAARSVERLVDELELGEVARRRVDSCSTGMLQQLAIARALLGDPPLLLLDEPTRSLDETAIERLWRAVDARPDAALLIATHRPEDVARCGRHLSFAKA